MPIVRNLHTIVTLHKKKGLSGGYRRTQVLGLREKRVEEGYNPYLKGYGTLLLKENYIFKNYRDVNSKIVFFPGNFPAYYPVTAGIISEN